MKKLLLSIILIGLLGCKNTPDRPAERELLKEIVIEYSETDEPYRRHGTQKEIYRIYNCKYEECDIHEIRPHDIMHGIVYHMNSYGDTVRIRYIDYTNYPRREE